MFDDDWVVTHYKQGLRLTPPGENQKNELTLGDCLQLPLSVYLLDTLGATLKINALGARICGFESPQEAVGLSLFDVSSQSSAESLIDNCKSVLLQERVSLFDECNVRKDSEELQFLSIKYPCYNQQDQMIGLLGFSIILGLTPVAELIATLSSLNLFPSHAAPADSAILKLNLHQVHLSQREYQCLELTVKGYSAKSIAKQLSLSNRTVETYLNTVKFKMGVTSKQALIAKVLS